MSYSDDINACVRRTVQLALGLPDGYVRPANQDASAGRQGTPFATVLIASSDEASEPSNEIEDDGEGGFVEASYVPDVVVAHVQFFKSPPTPADLVSGLASTTLADYTVVTDGGFDVPIDGANVQVTGLDFSAALTLDDVAAAVQAALPAGATCTWNGTRFTIASPTTDTSSSVDYGAPPTSSGPPTDVSTLLALTASAGASPSDNAAGIAKYNVDAFDLARRLPARLGLSAVVTLMQELGLGFMVASPARDLAAIADATYESRGSVDLTFNVISREAIAVAAQQSLTVGLQVEVPGYPLVPIQTRDIEVTPP